MAGAVVALALVVPGGVFASPAAHAVEASATGSHLYVVRAASAASAAAAVAASGGRVVALLPVVQGVDASLSESALEALDQRGGLQVTPDLVMHALGNDYSPGPQASQLVRMDLGGTWSPTAGSGIGVALIDTGVAPTPGITASHLVRGPNFSGSGSDFDGYGHGTFMAGLIAGNGRGGPDAVAGVAPGATLVAVKVAASDGSTSVAKVIEGIGWAVEHRDQYDIRVMSISFGATLPIPPSENPLDAAVEAAWASGITVVVASGNRGAGQVTSPGDDPWVITVGAETTTGPFDSPSWSSYSASKPDILAPGVSVESLRAAGSLIDRDYPDARVGGLYFRGSGTSMATALTAGAAALLIQHHPDATPDDVKGALISSEGPALVGHAGPVDVAKADAAVASPSWWQSHPISLAGNDLTNQTKMPWTAEGWTPATWNQAGSPSWSTMSWDTMSWDTMSWDTMSWDTMSWDTMSWDTMSWDDEGW